MRTETVAADRGQDALMRELAQRGLDPAALWETDANGAPPGTDVLERIVRWVRMYSRCPDRRSLERAGFDYPPVHPGCDPDTDWTKFERWMQHRPLTWNFCRDISPTIPPAELDEEGIERELVRVALLLADRGVAVDLRDGVPARVCYEYLHRELKEHDFEFTGPRTVIHLTGCSGDCESCFQEPWCDTRELFDDVEDGAVAVTDP